MSEKAAQKFVKVIAPSNLGNKSGKAFVNGTFDTKIECELSEVAGHIMTEKQANTFIKKWNKDIV
jgi:hypothetical protein